ncbi:hypothetical protein DERP_012348 [Dermatophagoides pteronyssinus]|uniref:Uncharacterized protein n=1 Tax=Dermatophagoides pteronyssinus TaxID=6956 RepID=A0ABQ8IUP7_DERPT|nr:hypothetical protein DERP_012348 [Dermatophagoides pteronyssinus]
MKKKFQKIFTLKGNQKINKVRFCSSSSSSSTTIHSYHLKQEKKTALSMTCRKGERKFDKQQVTNNFTSKRNNISLRMFTISQPKNATEDKQQ